MYSFLLLPRQISTNLTSNDSDLSSYSSGGQSSKKEPEGANLSAGRSAFLSEGSGRACVLASAASRGRLHLGSWTQATLTSASVVTSHIPTLTLWPPHRSTCDHTESIEVSRITSLSQDHSHTCRPLCHVKDVWWDILGTGLGYLCRPLFGCSRGTPLPGLGLLEAQEGVGCAPSSRCWAQMDRAARKPLVEGTESHTKALELHPLERAPHI